MRPKFDDTRNNLLRELRESWNEYRGEGRAVGAFVGQEIIAPRIEIGARLDEVAETFNIEGSGGLNHRRIVVHRIARQAV